MGRSKVLVFAGVVAVGAAAVVLLGVVAPRGSVAFDRGPAVSNSGGRYGLEVIDLDLKDVSSALEEAMEEKNVEKFCMGLTEDFEGSCFDGVIPVTKGIHRVKTGESRNLTPSKDAFRKALRAYLDNFEYIYEAHFKVKEYIEGEVFENEVEAKTKLDLRARRKDGGVHQEFVYWACRYRKYGSKWKIARARIVSREQAVRAKTLFREVTTAAGLLVGEQPEVSINGIGNIYVGTAAVSNYDYGGVCLYDVDGDGDLDIFMPNAYGRCSLYMNRGDGTFSEESKERGIDSRYRFGFRGAVFGDVDNDGDPDLYVCRSSFHHPKIPHEGNLFFENVGGGRFRDRTEEAGLAIDLGWSMTPIFFDYDRDGDLDLFVCNYGIMDPKTQHRHHPYNADYGEANFLYRNNGDGTFTDVAEEAGIAGDTYWSYAASVVDWNGDLYPDLYVANDFGPNQFYVNQKDGTFRNVAKELGLEDVGNGMGASFVDYRNDGRWDLYVTNMQSSTGRRVLKSSAEFADSEAFKAMWKLTLGNSFFLGGADGTFTDSQAISLGIADGGWSWNADFADFDADGDSDLFLVNGYYSAKGAKDC